jgi:probable phosphoglycerate mutase
MIKRTQMLRVIVLLPGATDLDVQGRIKGSLDIPLSQLGNDQAQQSARELSGLAMDAIYSGPSEAARQTATLIAGRRTRVRVYEELRNLDRGLWHGKRVSEVRESQPRLYRQWQESPDTVCPPGGETLDEARKRICHTVDRILRKHKQGTIAIVIHEPAASLLRQCLGEDESDGDLWQTECCSGGWEAIELVAADSRR